MQEIIKNRINDTIYRIVFDEKLSLIEQTAKVHQYFKNFEVMNDKRQNIIHFRLPEPETIKEIILKCYKTEDWLERPDLFKKHVLQATQVMKKAIVDSVFSELMI